MRICEKVVILEEKSSMMANQIKLTGSVHACATCSDQPSNTSTIIQRFPFLFMNVDLNIGLGKLYWLRYQ